MIRYYLINSLNEEWDFQPTDHDGQLQNIDGEGYELNSDYVNVQNYFVNVRNRQKQKKIKGEVVFLSEYKYEQFKSFLKQGGFKLKRVSHNNKELFADVDLVVAESNTFDRFNEEKCFVDIDFALRSMWHSVMRVTTMTGSNPKTYPYLYPYEYGGSTAAAFGITNRVDSPVSLKIKIQGFVLNPYWRLLQGNRIVSQGLYNGSVEEGAFLVISSDPNDLYVGLQRGTAINRNEYINCDVTKETFIFVPKGVFTLYIGAENGNVLVEVEARGFDIYP